jgi:hypothetical protein
VGLFTKKKLSDAERQAWSAQLLEVRAAELDEFADEDTLGSTWEEHDEEWSRLFLEYYVEFGILAWNEMAADGLRISGYRKFIEGEAMLVIENEFEEPPAEWAKGSVWWLVNTHQLDENGDQIWGYQYVAASWKEATGYMKDRVKDWDLENTRKTNKLWKDDWNRYFALVALAIVGIVAVIILAPIAAGVALGVALGETISVGLLASAVGTGLAQAAAFGDKYLSWGENLFGEPEVSADFIDALGAFDDGGGATIDDVINSPGVPVFTPGGELVALDEAPTNPAALASGGGLGLLLAAAAALTFVI